MIFGIGGEGPGRTAAVPHCAFLGEASMAVVRDQAARVLRPDAVETPTPAGGDAATETSVALAEQVRSPVAAETKRRPTAAPEKPVIDKPAAAPEAPAAAGAPKSGKRKF